MPERLRPALTATLLAVLVGTLGWSTPASAADPPSPVIVSPADGGTLYGDSTGPLVVDFPHSATYAISAACKEYDYGDTTYVWSNRAHYSGRQTINIAPLHQTSGAELTGMPCEIKIHSLDFSTYLAAESRFTVTAPPLTLGNIAATEPTFYPLVKDGYRDDTRFQFSVNRSAEATLTIADPGGKPVHTEGRALGRTTAAAWSWNGKTSSGKPVEPGAYRATITATADGVTVAKSATVEVATKTVKRRITKRQNGWLSSGSTRGNCTHSQNRKWREQDDYSMYITCRDGVFAAATYTFKVPANAKSIDWGANVSPSMFDVCCRGTISESGRRVGRTQFEVRVQVTRWRAARIRNVRVSYRVPVRI